MTGVSTLDRPPQPTAPTRYTVSLARDEADVRAAQRLRHDVFAGEMGALLATPQPGHDIDSFDAYCDHLLVREEVTGQVVGTYRLLPPERAAVAGRLYSESEFDLTALDAIRPGLVEVGRSCVHPDHRDGAVIGLIWAGIARYMVDRGHEWLAGCCSVPLGDGGALASATWERVRGKYLAPEEYRVQPLLPWVPNAAASATPASAELPALLRGYLRLGAWVCGQPAHDPDFGVADLYVLLSMRRVNQRYLRHFLSLVPS
ncbi:GNAT family N-acetyltransferase [Streptomyces sp. NBC_00201]|uniref:GNAT family N-acetyltransferase n=1 Tax=unclassified Streptomyces TaxID=2593676 RepID=UPI00224DB044|nr:MULTISPECIES: GNAT family N-acyltransferase [unclassified Streptomyces]MCX5063146.1 GNAT family N-acetyltransferase [Streptomyces sp. NBC_00452]MCX5250986.1 GNAT family N-acetyltransferase [Streptomyces sp. NBC_00201]MCX5291085.1 GNAT family N-acetyltransferase [Streptomyces sp. NBC_00183]